jgi:hypothetical protein
MYVFTMGSDSSVSALARRTDGHSGPQTAHKGILTDRSCRKGRSHGYPGNSFPDG